jgi:hypothetical protein
MSCAACVQQTHKELCESPSEYLEIILRCDWDHMIRLLPGFDEELGNS